MIKKGVYRFNDSLEISRAEINFVFHSGVDFKKYVKLVIDDDVNISYIDEDGNSRLVYTIADDWINTDYQLISIRDSQENATMRNILSTYSIYIGFDIVLYNNKSDDKVLNKDLELIKVLVGNFRNESTITSPNFLIEYDTTIDDTSTNINYCYIPILNRYYYVNNITLVRTNLLMLSCNVDVLMSNNTKILDLNMLIGRNEYSYNNFIEDTLLSYRTDKEINYYTPTNSQDCVVLFTQVNDNNYNAIMSFITNRITPIANDQNAFDSELKAISKEMGGVGLGTGYLVTSISNIQLQMFGILNDDNLRSYVKSLVVYPFNIPSTIVQGTKKILLGDTEITLADDIRIPTIYPKIKIADFTFTNAESFLDYSPYSIYEMYIPYCDYIQLNAEDILGKHIQVFYTINIEDGSNSAVVYNATDKRVIYTAQCTIGAHIGISSTNSREISNQKDALALNTAVSSFTSLLSIVGGAYSGNGYAVAQGVSNLGGTIGNSIINFKQLYNRASASNGSASNGVNLHQKVFIKITKAKPINYDNDDFLHLYGRPLEEIKKLSTLSGLTIVKEAYLDDLDYITNFEKEELLTLLKNGVIL